MKQKSEKFIIRHVNGKNRVLSPHSGERYEDADFRPIVMNVLQSIMSDYDIVEFSKTIYWSLQPSIGHQPDLIMVSKNRKKWIVVEVELSHHSLGYSYSSPMNKKSDHIYPQVETFAEGIYNEEHIKLLASKLDVDSNTLNDLLIFPPEILVIGDDESVFNTDDESMNWNRLENDFQNVHLGFVETFKWTNPSDSCLTYSGWVPTNVKEKIRLIPHVDWPNGLRCIKEDSTFPFSNNMQQISIEGISSQWTYNKKWQVLMPNCSLSTNWMEDNRDCKIFELSIGNETELVGIKH